MKHSFPNVHDTRPEGVLVVEPRAGDPSRIYLAMIQVPGRMGYVLDRETAVALRDDLSRLIDTLQVGTPISNTILSQGIGKHSYLVEEGVVIDGTIHFHEGVHLQNSEGRYVGARMHPRVSDAGCSNHTLRLRDWIATPAIEGDGSNESD